MNLRTYWIVTFALLTVLALTGVTPAQTLEPVTTGLSSRFVMGNRGISSWQTAPQPLRLDQTGDSVAASDAETQRFRRRPLYDLGFAGKTVVSDMGYIYSSPARLSKRSALWLGGIVAVGAVIYIYDQEIHDAMQRSRDDKLYKPIRELGESVEKVGFMGKTNKYYLGAILAGYLAGYEPMITIPAEILEAQLIAGTFKDFTNILVGRSRPFEDRGARSYKFNDGTSFPSGHAKNVMIAANVIARRVRFLPVQVAAYGLAGAVCLERITSGSHWPSDVYFAAVYGWIISNELVSRHTRQRVSIAPTTGNGGPGLSVRFTF